LRLRYTSTALDELEELLAYIAERSPQGARNVQRRIKTVIDLIAEHPGMGQLTRQPNLRRMVVLPYPYLVFYEVAAGEVIIAAIRHGARDPSTMPGGLEP
jgi:plasmid stabilization system protein ParE